MAQIANINFNFSERKILLRFFDVVVVLLSLYVVELLFEFNYFNISSHNFYWIIVLGIYLNILGTVFEMYNLQVASSQFYIIRSIVLTASTTVFFYLLTPVFTPLLPLNRLQILYFFLAVFLALLFWRIFYQTFLSSKIFEKTAVLVCDSEQLEQLVNELEEINSQYKIMGFFSPSTRENHGMIYRNIKSIEVEELELFVKKNNIMEVVIASQSTEEMAVALYKQLQVLLKKGFVITEYSQLYENLAQRIPIQFFNKDFYRYFPFSQGQKNEFYLSVVRILEVIFALVGLVIGLLILPFIAIGNLIGNRGSLFYSQERVGKSGKIFKIYKFRTMIENAEKNGAVYASANDVRITPFGKFLRNTRLDEFPQFINILNGEMALIGPRPERPFFVNELVESIPFYEVRHFIKPGLTGWAQVNYSYGSSLNDSLVKLQYDLYYIKHRNVFLDINILIKTITTVLFYRGQ